jgi:hypothetical protein
MRKSIIAAMLGILYLAAPVRAEEAPNGPSGFGLNITAGAEQSYWQINRPNQCQGCPEGVVDYKTEGLGLYRVNAILLYGDQAFLKLQREAPLSPSERQNESLLVNQTHSVGAETFGLDVALDAFAQRWFPGQNAAHYALRTITSLKFTSTRELFWGEARAREDATFVPIGQTIDYSALPIPDTYPVPAGQPLSFSTVFSNRELSVAVFRFGGKGTPLPDSAVRVGWYDAEWRRLSDARLTPLSTKPVIFEAKFRSQGILIAAENRDPGTPGLNFEGSMRWGIVNELETAFDWKKLYGEDLRVETNMVTAGAWYNWYFDKTSRQGWAVTAGTAADLRNTKIQLNPGAYSADTVSGSSDFIFRFYASLSRQI